MGLTAAAGTDAALRAVEERVLWLATAIVDHANHVRPNPDRLKVGGHQASSASMVTIMTSLWLEQLGGRGPGLGKAARLAGAARAGIPARRPRRGVPDLAAAVRRPAELPEPAQGPRARPTTRPARSASGRPRRSGARWPAGTSPGTSGAGGTGRQWSLVGDAELDEGAVWEAVLDPMVAELGEVVWVVDLNRQSLDRVVPDDGCGPAAGHVRRGRLAGAHGQVRPAAGGAVRPARRRGAAGPDRRHVQRRVPAAAAPGPGRAARPRCPAKGPVRPTSPELIADVAGRPAGRRGPQPRRARPRRAAGRRTRPSTTAGRR